MLGSWYRPSQEGIDIYMSFIIGTGLMTLSSTVSNRVLHSRVLLLPILSANWELHGWLLGSTGILYIVFAPYKVYTNSIYTCIHVNRVSHLFPVL